MAMSLRNSARLLRTASARGSILKQAPQRGLSSKQAGTGYAALRPILLGGASLAAVVGIYNYKKKTTHNPFPVTYAAAAAPPHQASVISETKEHALYLTIHLKPGANAKACAKVVANLPAHVDVVCPPDLRDENDEILAGVGFGPAFYTKVFSTSSWFGFVKTVGNPQQNYAYPHRKGALGEMPSTGGDIFIHAKSHSRSKLFELAQRILAQLPAGSVDKFDDIYGWVYRNGRDLSGFIDGTENPADDEERHEVAVEKGTGGSYVITQKWVHQLDVINSEKDSTMAGWIGRDREDSIELKNKPITSHVARMTGGAAFEQPKKFRIVRQSQPYGSLAGDAGLFFIGYAASPENFEYMLDRMVGKDADGHSDDVMRLTKCVAGTYFYFPGVNELNKLK